MLDPLESRTLFSGNVTANLIDGALILTGDAAANRIILSQHPDGSLRLTPLSATTINNAPAELRFPRPAGPIRISLADGDDSVELRNVNVPSHLSITTGNGNDTVTLRSTPTPGKLLITTGDGDDRVTLRNSSIVTSARIRTGAGDDRILTRATTFPTSDTLIDPGSGTNDVDREVILNWNFLRGLQGWKTNVADFDPAINPQNSSIQFRSAIVDARSETGINAKVLRLSGQNLSDDLILYLTRKLTAADGLRANQAYSIEFTVTYLSDRPTNLIGRAEYLKLGAVPQPIVRTIDPETGLYTLNLDRGNQVADGPDASLVGLVNNGLSESETWTQRTIKHTHTSTPSTDASGNLHLFAATESTFETATSMRYVSIGVKLTPVNA